MFTCSNCPYSSTDKSNYLRHCNRKTACGPKKTINMSENVTHSAENITNPAENITRFVTLNDKQVSCVDCGKCLSNKYKKYHLCRGVPLNMCKFCKKQFNHSSNLSAHRKHCKDKKHYELNSNEGPSSVIQLGKEHMDLLIERLRVDNDDRLQAVQTELKKDYEQKIKLLKFDYDNDREIMQELLQHQNDHMSILTDSYFFNKEYIQRINKVS